MQVASKSSWFCEECGSKRFVDRDGFRWCIGCGIGTQIFERLHRVPGVGADTHYAPENQLCFGKGLGNPAVNSKYSRKALYQVLAQNNTKDLGIRAIQIKNECMRSQEPSVAQRMKSYGSNLCKRYGFGDNVLLSNALGFNLKWIATILTMQNEGSHSKDLAVATFLLNVKKFYGWEKTFEIMMQVWGRTDDVRLHVPESKKRYIATARNLIHLHNLVV
jgi:hypothetical protein